MYGGLCERVRETVRAKKDHVFLNPLNISKMCSLMMAADRAGRVELPRELAQHRESRSCRRQRSFWRQTQGA